MKTIIEQVRTEVLKKQPLVHAITNPISINDCANAMLAIGARPVMAEHPQEVKGIVAGAGALLLNLGNITDARIESMPIAAQAARANGKPIVLDVVGVGCSTLRLGFAQRLLQQYKPEVVKGNAAEIQALLTGEGTATGVDAEQRHLAGGLGGACMLAKQAALALDTCVLVSGPADVVAVPGQAYIVQGGSGLLGRITGTGCMQGCLAAAFVTATQPLYAALLACAMMKGAGFAAAEKCTGPGSFRAALLDSLAMMDAKIMWRGVEIAPEETE